MGLKIKYSRNTVGCRIKDEIYLHPELYTSPELYKAVLMHEAEHTSGYSMKDVLMDLVNSDLEGHKREYYKFMFKHPRTFLGWLPIVKVGPYWTLDATMFGFTLVTAGVIYLIIRSLT